MAPMGKFKKNLNCYNSDCTQDTVVIFDSMHHLNLPPDYPCCHGNKIWDKIG